MIKKISLTAVAMALMVGAYTLSAGPKGPCYDDVQKLCKSETPGKGHIWNCLQEHENQLSDACRAHREGLKEKHKAFMDACKADMQSYCKDQKPGRGQKIRCLRQNKDKLSDACKAQFAAPPAGEQ